MADPASGVFVFVGSVAEADAFLESKRHSSKGLSLRTVDCNQLRAYSGSRAIIIPGIIDSHVHILEGGKILQSISLESANNKEQFRSIVQSYVQSHPNIEWILGGNWDHERWGGELPTKEWIDDITGNKPAWVRIVSSLIYIV